MIPLISADHSMAKTVILNCGVVALFLLEIPPLFASVIYFVVISQLYLV